MFSRKWSRWWTIRMSSSRRTAPERAGELKPGPGGSRARPAWRRARAGLLLGLMLGLPPGLAPDALARPKGPPVFPPVVALEASREEGLPLAARNKNHQNLSPEEMDKLKKKWRSLPPEKREEYRRRMERFNRLPDEDRQLFRRRHEQLQRLSPQERQRLQRQLDQWDQLSPQEREKIRRRFINQLHLPGPGARPRIVG